MNGKICLTRLLFRLSYDLFPPELARDSNINGFEKYTEIFTNTPYSFFGWLSGEKSPKSKRSDHPIFPPLLLFEVWRQNYKHDYRRIYSEVVITSQA